MEEYLVLNRQNTMVYYDGNKSIIKNYFKEVSLETSREQYEILLNLLNVTKREISVKDLYNETKEDSYVMKLLKVLYETGSVFIYPLSNNLSKYFQKGWFSVLLQYLPPHMDIVNSCGLLDDAVVFINQDIEHELPVLRSLLIANDLTVANELKDEVKPKDWIITTESEFFHHNSIELSLSNDKLVGVHHANQSNKKIKRHKVGNRPTKESLLYKVGPYYTMLYIVKSIIGISKSTFTLNKEGSFYEYDFLEENFKQTIEEISFPKSISSLGGLEYVGSFEEFINKESAIPISISGWKDDNYADIYQMGFATYALTNRSTKDTFVYAGLDYIETAINSIAGGLEYYLNIDSTQNSWMVTSPEYYYQDKALFLLRYIDEPYTIYKIDQKIYRNKELIEYFEIMNLKLEFYVKKYKNSNSITVYLYDEEREEMYSDGKRTINIEYKMLELSINYILLRNNLDKPITSILLPIDNALKKELLQTAINNLTNIKQIDQTNFVENCIKLFEQFNLNHVESAWKYEEQLIESNLIVREIEVETN